MISFVQLTLVISVILLVTLAVAALMVSYHLGRSSGYTVAYRKSRHRR